MKGLKKMEPGLSQWCPLTRVNVHKWEYKKFHLNIRDFFAVRVVKSWNRNREYVEDIFNNLIVIQKPTALEHPALADPALHSGAELDSHQRCLPT